MFDVFAPAVDLQGQQRLAVAGVGLVEQSQSGVFGAGIDGRRGMVDFIGRGGFVDQPDTKDVVAVVGDSVAFAEQLPGAGRVTGRQRLSTGIQYRNVIW